MTYEEALKRATIIGNRLNLYVNGGTNCKGFRVIGIFKQTGSLQFDQDFHSFLMDAEHESIYYCTGFTSDHHYEEHVVMSDYAIHFIFEV